MDFSPPPELQHLTRRGFLKLAGGSLLSLLAAQLPGGVSRALAQATAGAPALGRVTSKIVNMRAKPSITADIVRRTYMDEVLPITGITLGDDYPAYNRIWYQINGEGFVHSGLLQPVEVRLNQVVKTIPSKGQLAEVTVPFTDSRFLVKPLGRVAFRLYYSSVYWVVGVAQAEDGKYWYQIYDERQLPTFVDCAHLRLLPPAELSPLSPQVPTEDKHIEVRLADQVVIAYEGERAVFMTRAATGAKFRDGDFRTKKGAFQTARKRPTRHMAAGEPGIGTGFDLPGVPWVSYITEEGVAFHGTYWHNDFGAPRSHGCINLSTAAALWIYRWTLPSVPVDSLLLEEDEGTRVQVV